MRIEDAFPSVKSKRDLQGSPSRDVFKRCHKQKLDGKCYATDADLVLVGKNPPGIIAYLDFKLPADQVTFSEILAYNEWMKSHPVYIIQSPDPERGPFDVFRYLGGNWRPNPPVCELEQIEWLLDWNGLQRFEDELRK